MFSALTLVFLLKIHSIYKIDDQSKAKTAPRRKASKVLLGAQQR